MRELFVSSTLFATIITCLAFGVMLGYTVILGILHLISHRRQAPRPAPRALIPASDPSGD